MAVGLPCFRHPTNRLNTRLTTHANHAQGVQYATTSFVWGVNALQTRGATPIEAMKSAKSGFHLGTLPSISNNTLFMRSVSAALGSPPKYSKASIKQRIIVGASQRLTKVTKRMRE